MCEVDDSVNASQLGGAEANLFSIVCGLAVPWGEGCDPIGYTTGDKTLEGVAIMLCCVCAAWTAYGFDVADFGKNNKYMIFILFLIYCAVILYICYLFLDIHVS